MKGIRFYLEYADEIDKRHKKDSGNVFAAFIGQTHMSGRVWMQEGIGAIYSEPNSPVCGTSASLSFLSDYCKRISEAEARKIHPKLFERLEIE